MCAIYKCIVQILKQYIGTFFKCTTVIYMQHDCRRSARAARTEFFLKFFLLSNPTGCTEPAQAFLVKQSQAVPAWQKHFS